MMHRTRVRTLQVLSVIKETPNLQEFLESYFYCLGLNSTRQHP